MVKEKLTVTGISEFKAKLSKFLRLVKAGETIEIQERGVPVATLSKRVLGNSKLPTVAPRRDPTRLANYPFSVRPKKSFDPVELLLDERRKR